MKIKNSSPKLQQQQNYGLDQSISPSKKYLTPGSQTANYNRNNIRPGKRSNYSSTDEMPNENMSFDNKGYTEITIPTPYSDSEEAREHSKHEKSLVNGLNLNSASKKLKSPFDSVKSTIKKAGSYTSLVMHSNKNGDSKLSPTITTNSPNGTATHHMSSSPDTVLKQSPKLPDTNMNYQFRTIKSSSSNKTSGNFNNPDTSNMTSNVKKSRALENTQKEVDQVVDIMRGNIEKILDRESKLDELDSRCEHLKDSSSAFQSTTQKVKHKYWWKDKLYLIIIISVILIILIAIIISLIVHFSK